MKRDMMILVAAILMGVAAVVFTQVRMSQIEHALSSQISNKVAICILKEATGPQQLLREEMLDAREVPEIYRHPQSIAWKDRSRIVGQRLRHPIQAEQPLVWSDLLESSKRTIGGSILPNRGVVTIPIDMVGGVSGLIAPGARVDVVGVFNSLPIAAVPPAMSGVAPAETGADGAKPSEPTLADVNQALVEAAKKKGPAGAKRENEFYVVSVARNLGVFAVGNQTQMDAEEQGSRGGYGTISFDVPPQLQTVLIMAVTKIENEGGRLVCVLRSNEGGDAGALQGTEGEVRSSEDFLKLIGTAQSAE